MFKAFARATNTMVFFMVNAHMTACMRHLVTEVADLLQSDMGRLQLPNVRKKARGEHSLALSWLLALLLSSLAPPFLRL